MNVKDEILIGFENPVEDYTRLIKKMVENVEELIEEETRSKDFDKIASAMQATIWKLLFDDGKNETHSKAEEALKTYRMDACFYNPWNYNDWIYLVREELRKRKMSKFWKNVICKYELGLCWARDCDYFDDIDDPTPREFYEIDFDTDGNTTPVPSKLPVLKLMPDSSIVASCDANVDMQKFLDIYAPCFGHHNSPTTQDDEDKSPISIGVDDPVSDYKNLIDRKVECAKDDDQMSNNFDEIAKAARNCIWKLLFESDQNDPIVLDKNMKKAENLLEIYKRDACFHNPWDYNEFIPKVRDELLKRKMFLFWKDVIVAKKLGLCWARDSDLFDDLEDPKPMEFYNVTSNIADLTLASKPKT